MQNPPAELRIPAVPTFPLSSPITEEVPSPAPSSPEDHDMERNRPFTFLNKATRKNPFIHKAAHDKHVQEQEAVDGTRDSYQTEPLGLYTGKRSNRPPGLNLVTDFSPSTPKGLQDTSVPTIMDLNDLKALSKAREQERATHNIRGILKKDSNQVFDRVPDRPSGLEKKRLSYFNFWGRKKAKDDLSPSDRPIMIGLSMPFDGSPSSHEDQLKVNTGDAQRAALTPSIIVTPAKEDTFWPEISSVHPRPRVASSIYSQPTPYPDDNDKDLEIPPVPAIPDFPFLKEAGNTGNEPAQRRSIATAGRQRAFSTGTVFEEDDVRRVSRSRSYSSGTIKKIPDRLSINTETNRHQSEGWWTYLLSPLLGRFSTAMGNVTPTEAARPPVPSIRTQLTASSDEWWEKEVSCFSPDTPEAAEAHHNEALSDWSDDSVNLFDEKDLNNQDRTIETGDRGALSFMFPGQPIQGSAAEYYQACAHELFSGRPYFECINHVCSITPKDKIPGYTETTVSASSHERGLLVDVEDAPRDGNRNSKVAVPTTIGPQTQYEPSVMDKRSEVSLDDLKNNNTSDDDLSGLPSTEYRLSQHPSSEHPLSEHPRSGYAPSSHTLIVHPPSVHPSNEHPASECPPSEHRQSDPIAHPPTAYLPGVHPPSEQSPPDDPIPNEQTRGIPQDAAPESHVQGETEGLAPPADSQTERKISWPIFQPMIQPAPQPAIQPVIQPAPQPVIQHVIQPTPPIQHIYVHPATVPSPILIAPPDRVFPRHSMLPTHDREAQPQPPNPTSPGLQQATERGGSIPLSDMHASPAPAYTSSHNSSSALLPRMEPHPTTREEVRNTTIEREVIEFRRQTLEKKEDKKEKKGNKIFAFCCCCCGRGQSKQDRNGKVKRRWYLAILTSFLIIIAIILLLVMTLTRKGDSTPVQSQWLNLTGYPPMPTGIATIAGPEPQAQVSGCIAPSTLWSCALPPEQQSANAPYAANEPNFRVEILFRNGTYPNSTTIASKSRRTLSSRSSDNPYSPSPSPPSMKDQAFLGNTTDNNTVPYAGEETPFYMTILSASHLTSTSTLRLARRSDSSFPNLATIIPSPDENSDGTAASADLYPQPSSQPVRLYNRGLSTEHYGFYTYFDRSIFLSSLAPINGSTTDDDPNDTNGGSNESEARVRCTWSQTRFLVQIWTRSNDTLLKSSTNASSTTTTAAATATATANSSATDWTRPGSFPYPVTITLDRHGGDAKEKMVYCYGMESDEKINSTDVKLQLEDRSYGGQLINPAPGIFDLYSNSSSDATGEWGGIDGGTGGCSCKWANWVSIL